jgi:drug/metabolite transporter (DMT)-like permease
LQLAPLFFAIGGSVFFGEPVSARQWVCFAAMFGGLFVFLKGANASDNASSKLVYGTVIMVACAVAWSAYALLQKKLMERVDASNVLLSAYALGAVALLPIGHYAQLMTLSPTELMLIVLCCADTVLAYWSFTQALRYWRAVQVSSAIALAPVATFALTFLVVVAGWSPRVIRPTVVDAWGIVAIVIVILSAVGVQVFRKNGSADDGNDELPTASVRISAKQGG